MRRKRLKIALNNAQQQVEIDPTVLRSACQLVLEGEGRTAADISLAIVDDVEIHRVNREFLQHDYPTDVISFVLDETPQLLEGEVVASAEYAAREAPQHGWTALDELALYIIHGTLHLVGYDDLDPDSAAIMRERERHYLTLLGRPPVSTGAAATKA